MWILGTFHVLTIISFFVHCIILFIKMTVIVYYVETHKIVWFILQIPRKTIYFEACKVYVIMYKYVLYNLTGSNVSLRCVQSIDISALLVHHLCVVCITLTALRTEPTRRDPTSKDSFVINVSGRLLMVHQNNSQVIHLL